MALQNWNAGPRPGLPKPFPTVAPGNAVAYLHSIGAVARLNVIGDRQTQAACHELLRTAPYTVLRQVVCIVDKGVLTLRGQVPSYYLKQVAQTILGTTEGVERLVNQIHVVRAGCPSSKPGEPVRRITAEASNG